MQSLLDLPDHLLDNIIKLILPLPQDLDEAQHMSKILDAKSRSLLLCCRRLNTLATQHIFSTAVFGARSIPRLNHFIDLAGHVRLRLVRNMAVALDLDEENHHHHGSSLFSWFGMGTDMVRADKEVEKAAELLKRLPERLHRLRVEARFDEWPFFVTEREAHPRLREALHRFARLEELRLDLSSSWLHPSLFSSLESPSTAPVFPSLRRLYVGGCLTKGISAAQVTNAFSQEQLPALQAVTFAGLLYDIEDEVERSWVFLPEAIMRMNPLTEFVWIHFDMDLFTAHSGAQGAPHQPPTKAHLEALRMRHGRTLRRVVVDYTCCSPGMELFDMGVEEEDLNRFVNDMPGLKRVSIEAPRLDLVIKRG